MHHIHDAVFYPSSLTLKVSPRVDGSSLVKNANNFSTSGPGSGPRSRPQSASRKDTPIPYKSKSPAAPVSYLSDAVALSTSSPTDTKEDSKPTEISQKNNTSLHVSAATAATPLLAPQQVSSDGPPADGSASKQRFIDGGLVQNGNHDSCSTEHINQSEPSRGQKSKECHQTPHMQAPAAVSDAIPVSKRVVRGEKMWP